MKFSEAAFEKDILLGRKVSRKAILATCIRGSAVQHVTGNGWLKLVFNNKDSETYEQVQGLYLRKTG